MVCLTIVSFRFIIIERKLGKRAILAYPRFINVVSLAGRLGIDPNRYVAEICDIERAISYLLTKHNKLKNASGA
jgi:hypothetical protein